MAKAADKATAPETIPAPDAAAPAADATTEVTVVKKTELLAKQKFAAWGHEYNPGDIIPQDHYLAWPEGTLVNRLNGGDVVYGIPGE